MLGKEVLLYLSLFLHQSYAKFTIPDVILEAYEPQGFRASIPAIDGIQMFAFHGNINKEINQVDPGDYSGDFTAPINNMWSYYNGNVSLKVGDEINYWIFIQHEKLGYRKDDQKWKVTELIKLDDKPCEDSITSVWGKTLICKSNLVFEENFSTSNIDINKWTIEQYIPAHSSLDFEFVSYQNRPDVCYISNNKLFIKPQVTDNDDDVYGELDLRGSCTRKKEEECYFKREIYLIVPPVTSGRLVSKFRFKYGKIEIRAKLPSGDWIYPQMYLEQVNNPRRKLWLGYARGNDKLLANNQEDIGGSLLFGGPVLEPSEPDRSQYLKSKQNRKTYTSQMHTYTVIWDKDHISLQVDGQEYGEIDKKTLEEISFSEDDLVQIVLGVGVGGVNDFPDDYRSGNNVKPWKNNSNKQLKKFFQAKENWLKTWKITTDNRALQVDYVKVWAV